MLLFGYDQGVLGGLLTGRPFQNRFPALTNNSTLRGFTVAVYELGCAAGAVFAFFCGDRLGRRQCIMLGMLVLSIGAILQFMVRSSSTSSPRRSCPDSRPRAVVRPRPAHRRQDRHRPGQRAQHGDVSRTDRIRSTSTRTDPLLFAPSCSIPIYQNETSKAHHRGRAVVIEVRATGLSPAASAH